MLLLFAVKYIWWFVTFVGASRQSIWTSGKEAANAPPIVYRREQALMTTNITSMSDTSLNSEARVEVADEPAMVDRLKQL